MMPSLRNILSPPENLLNAEKASLATFLNTFLLFSAVIIPVQQLFVISGDPLQRRLLVTISWLAMVVMTRLALQRGLVKTASIGSLAACWLWITVLNATAGGLTAPSFAAHVVLIFAAGITVGAWGAIAAGFMAVATAVVFLLLEQNALLPVPVVQDTPLRNFVVYTTLFIIAVPVALLALRHKQAALQLVSDSEEKRRSSERQLAKIIEFLPDPTLVINAQGRVTAWNLAIESMTGVQSEEMIGKGDYEYALPFYGVRRPILIDLVTRPPDEIKEKYSYLRHHNGFLAGEALVPALRGEEAFLTATAAVLQDERGRYAGAIECIRDITERKRAGEALRESGDRLRIITDTVKDAIIMIDNNGKVSYWNPAAQAIFGYAADEVLGMEFNSLLIPERFRDDYRRGLASFRKTGHIPVLSKSSELIALRKDGTEFPAEISISAIKIQGTWQAVLSLRDIFVRKQAEHELQGAKDAAEAANRAKSAFLAMMSHEIRTPMNAIIGMSSLLLDGDLPPQQRDFAQTIRTSGEALLAIINDILDFSKIEAGRLSLENRSFDLRQPVESSLDLFAHRARGKGLEMGFFIDSHAPIAMVGDPNRLQQILVNLVGNAVKFTEKGEIVVAVNARHLEAQPSTENPTENNSPAAVRDDRWFELQFTVRDTGIGIPADRMGRLFQAFSQADSSTARKYGGTGLGLAICKRLTEMMGGRIWVESEVGKGSAFCFTIRARAEPGAGPPYLAAGQPTLSRKRVLIVDDNPSNRQILALQLASWKMEAVTAGTGEEALEILKRGDTFDLIILDQQMPEMDGLALSERIMALPGGQAVPLVMLSFSPEELEPAQRQWFRAVLLKPVKASRLYDAFLEIFCPAGAAAPTTATAAESSPFDPTLGTRCPLRILLAEDNASNQKLALAMLERLGYRADVAGNGTEVLEALARQPYDLVLMDVQMPEMDGLEATREIRRCVAAERQPRIIALTADAMEEDRKLCFAAGMDDYVSKPILVPDLVGALSRSAAKLAAASSTAETAGTPTEDTDQPVPAPAIRKLEPVAGEPQPRPEMLDRNALERVKQTLGKQADAMFPVLLQSFQDDSIRFLADARRALQEANAADLRRAAHSLKSHAATFGALALAAAARHLEQLARDGIFAGAAELIGTAEQEFVKVKTALRPDGEEDKNGSSANHPHRG